jgi:hypothetical protein
VPERSVDGRQRPSDEGAADPVVAAALAAYAAGAGSEHAVLTALAGSRLLVPVVAVLADAADEAGEANAAHEAAEADGAGPVGRRCDIERQRAHPMSHRRDWTGQTAGVNRADQAADPLGAAGVSGTGEKVSEMALPTLVGRDGRVAVPAFTCLDSLTRWRRDARPVPVPADRVWEAATQAAQEASAVVIDVAGPVPLALDGARLAALAEGRKVPLPYEDPDVQAAAEAAVASEPLITGGMLARPGDDSDLALQVTLAAGCDAAQAGAAVRRAVTRLMAATGGRFRRGVEVAVVEAVQTRGRP